MSVSEDIAEMSRRVVENRARRATKIYSTKLKVTVTQRMYRFKTKNVVRGRPGSYAELSVTVGPLNYSERKALKACRMFTNHVYMFPVPKVKRRRK